VQFTENPAGVAVHPRSDLRRPRQGRRSVGNGAEPTRT
jgi:hypothetical protein